MNYEHLFQKQSSGQVNAGLVGAGTFGISLLAQARSVPGLRICAVCDRHPDLARRACRRAGYAEPELVICDTREQVMAAVETGRCAVVDAPELLLHAPVDVLVESTGDADAGACHAAAAISMGMHVVMVTKETDAVIGSLLHRRAASAGLVYTQADGDQPALLISLLSWARHLGLDVHCGGKAREFDLVVDVNKQQVSSGAETIHLSEEDWAVMQVHSGEDLVQAVSMRHRLLSSLSMTSPPDLCEMTIVANTTGLMPDAPGLHAPIVHMSEIPHLLCAQSDGGILETRGAVDLVNCLVHAGQAGFGGGVFAVVSSRQSPAWEMIRAKGLPVNDDGTCGLLARPFHLMGAEAIMSVLCAGLLRVPTGAGTAFPRVDMVARTTEDITAGTVLEVSHDHTVGIAPELAPASPIANGQGLPYYMANGRALLRDIPANSIITAEMIDAPDNSRLWGLRQEQDRTFLEINGGS